MNKFIVICFMSALVLCSINCEKESNRGQEIKSPIGTWLLIKKGRQSGDGTTSNWSWKNVAPAEAYKITFKDDNVFISYEMDPPINGTFTFSDGSLEILIPTVPEQLGEIKGKLENNILTLRSLVGADGAEGLQFRFFNQN